MQQRQLRLGDILDDYCPRERRVTNHAVVAMIGEDVKQTRCTTCEADHEYKHAKVPRQRRKTDTPAALYSQVLASGPKRVTPDVEHVSEPAGASSASAEPVNPVEAVEPVEPDADVAGDVAGNIASVAASAPATVNPADQEDDERDEAEGPVHRPLIRASLPRQEGQQPPARPIPEFTIRQPAGRPTNRFRPRHQHGVGGGGGQQFQGNRSNNNGGTGNPSGGPPRGGMRSNSGRPPQGGMPSRMGRRQGPPGRNRSK